MKKIIKSILLICISIFMLTLFTGCEGNLLDKITPGKKVSGNGVVASAEYGLSDDVYSLSIKEINFLFEAGMLEVNEDLANSLIISSDQNILELLTVDITDGKISISPSHEESYRYAPTEFKITVGVPIDDILIDGAFDVNVKLSSVEGLSVTSNGIINGEMHIGETKEFNYLCTGKDGIKFYGRADVCNVIIKGVSKIDAINLVTRKTNITLFGASSYTAYVTEELKAELNGLATLKYAGAPHRIIPTINGLGSIKEIES